MHALVTGAAGFIGSSLTDRLLFEGHTVRGVDCGTDYYDPVLKQRNISGAREHPNFTLHTDDLGAAPLDPLLDGIDVVFHLAGQPGVRASWGAGFAEYVAWNVNVTQRLLEACRDRPITRFVNSSSSSVYGDAERYPTAETDLPRPKSPYGVTKLAAEHLCTLYGQNFGVPTISLRYFTVYGPRQRPDMAMNKLIAASQNGTEFPLHGDGGQIRDFTFITDVVAANIAAALVPTDPGTVVNIGGGTSVTLLHVIDTIGELVGSPIRLERLPAADGDPRRTGADASRSRALLDWAPTVQVREGLEQQVSWQLSVPR